MAIDSKETTQNSALPLFYKRPTVLRFEDHQSYRLLSSDSYAFAAEATAIPVGVGEFVPAMQHYPIVFADAEFAAPIIVTGLTARANLFVEEDGSWTQDTYVPAYVRRYPFVVVEAGDQQLLAIDAESDRFVDDDAATDAASLFEADGTPSEVGRSAMEFCHAFHQDHLRAAAFVKAITEAGILIQNRADMQFPDGNRFTLNGFRVIDEKAYRSLSPDVREDWHKKGWSDLITLHLASQQNWKSLMKARAGRQVT